MQMVVNLVGVTGCTSTYAHRYLVAKLVTVVSQMMTVAKNGNVVIRENAARRRESDVAKIINVALEIVLMVNVAETFDYTVIKGI